jgi:hypothetical protein
MEDCSAELKAAETTTAEMTLMARMKGSLTAASLIAEMKTVNWVYENDGGQVDVRKMS